MPIAQSDQLFNLIKSLNKAEKRNFRLYVKRLQSNKDVMFVRVFDVMDKMDEYDEEQFFNKLNGIRKGQFPNLKRHLYTQILKSLRLISIEKDVEIQIREELDYCKILYGKGLYLQSLKLLDRVRNLAIQSNNHLLLLEAMEFQKFIEERHITRSRTIKGKMEKLLSDVDEQQSLVSNLVQLSNLKIKIHGLYIRMGHVRNEKDHLVVQEYFQTALEKVNKHSGSFFEQVYLHQSFMWYNYILLDFEKCYEHAWDWVRLFQEHPEMQQTDPGLYMRGLSYALTSLYGLRDHRRFQEVLDEFERFTASHQDQFNNTQKIINFLYLYTARINMHLLEGSFDEGIKLVPDLNRQVEKYGRFIDVHRIMVFNYKTAWLYFGAGEYGKAIENLNEIINLSAGHLREDLQCYARLLHLIAHYELGHTELLEYLVESVHRFFVKMEDLNKVQAVILEFFRKNLHREPEEIGKEFRALHREVAELRKNPYEIRAFLHMDILSWIESKIEIKSLQEVVQRKFESN